MSKAKTVYRPKVKFKSLHDAYTRANAGDQDAQRCIVGCLENMGCDHLADGQRHGDGEVNWLRYWRGLNQYIMCLVVEYQADEGQAERDVLAELNAARSYSMNVQL